MDFLCLYTIFIHISLTVVLTMKKNIDKSCSCARIYRRYPEGQMNASCYEKCAIFYFCTYFLCHVVFDNYVHKVGKNLCSSTTPKLVSNFNFGGKTWKKNGKQKTKLLQMVLDERSGVHHSKQRP